MSSSVIPATTPVSWTAVPDGSAASPSFAFQNSSGTGFYRVSANVLGISTAGVQRVVVDASGNVGVGTASGFGFADKVSVSGGNVVVQRTSGIISILGDNTQAGYTGTASNHPFVFLTNTTERARIDVNGNLLVGTTSSQARAVIWDAGGSNPTVRVFKNAASTLANPCLTLDKYDNNTTTSQVFAQFTVNNQGTASGQINANGANQVAFGSWSDERLKENIADLQPQLANILALRPVEFDYIESEGGGHQIGFVAQEMQQVYADAIGERADGMLSISGWDKTTARLVKAIQELSAKVDAQAAEIEALKAE